MPFYLLEDFTSEDQNYRVGMISKFSNDKISRSRTAKNNSLDERVLFYLIENRSSKKFFSSEKFLLAYLVGGLLFLLANLVVFGL